MEQWEALLDEYSANENTQVDVKGLIKILQTASVLLNEDLAEFELAWILKSLLYKPINLLEVIVSKHSYDMWYKPIEDSFKLLSSAVSKYGDVMYSYYEPIGKVCQLSFEPGTEKQALHCLSCIAKNPDGFIDNIEHYILALEGATRSKTSRALFIGAVCEHQPLIVERHKMRIWRIFLNLLDSNKNTDTIVAAVLQGIFGLFKNFGQNLPVVELNNFYGKMSTLYIRSAKCYNIVLSILEHHADLFKECIAGNSGLRCYIWSTLNDASGAAALLSIYKVVFDVTEHKEMQHILTSEVIPRMSTNTVSTYTALRVRAYAQNAHNVHVDVENLPSVESLEFELRTGTVSKDVADSVMWSIECGLMNSDRLQRVCLMFYKNIPSSKLKEVIVHIISKTTPVIRKAAIKFLISETCQDSMSFDTYLPLWTLMLDSNNGKDAIILEGSKFIFEVFMDYTNRQLKGVVGCTMEEKYLILLKLCAKVVGGIEPEGYTEERSVLVFRQIVQYMRKWGICSTTVFCCRALLPHVKGQEDTTDFYTMLTIAGCKDETSLCECCLVLLDANSMCRVQDKIDAFQVILSRNDLEPKRLSYAINQLDTCIYRDNSWVEDNLPNMINLIKKLRSRKRNMTGKDARILQKDIMCFLAKHGSYYDVVREKQEDMLVVQLKSCLNLNLLNPESGVTYKLNLGRILQMALQEENPEVLQTMLTVISATLVHRKEPCLQSAVSVTSRALCRAHAQTKLVDPEALHQALLLCDDIQAFSDFISFIRSERSPGVRRMLSDALESVMMSGVGRDFSEQLITAVGEHCSLMLDASDSLSRKAGLYLIETLIDIQRNNTAAVASLLPDILVKIIKTYDQDSIEPLESVTTTLREQIELHSNERLEALLQKILEVLTFRPTDTSSDVDRIYKKTVDLCLQFVAYVCEYKQWDSRVLFKVKCGDCVIGWLYVIVYLKRRFMLSDDIVLEVLSARGIIAKLHQVSVDNDPFVLETILEVLTEFATVFITSQREKSFQYLSNLISELTPATIIETSKTLTTCYNKYSELSGDMTEIDNGLKKWWNRLPLQTVTDNLKSKCYNGQIASIVSSMVVMLNFVNKRSLDSELVKTWPKLVFQAQKSFVNTFLADTLTVALQFFTADEVTKLLMEYMSLNNPSTGQMSPIYINVFFDHLLRESLLDSLEGDVILKYLVNWFREKSAYCFDSTYDTILRLFDKLWPAYESKATFEQKVKVLLKLQHLVRNPKVTSAPWTWATTRLVEGSISERIRLVSVLPPGEDFSSAYKSFASLLPTRLSELNADTNAILRSLLDAATNGDLTLLNVVASLVAGDDTKGWWDEAIDSYMATLAIRNDTDIYDVVYKRCWEGLSTGVCDRLLVPLLRYSPIEICEEYLPMVVKELFDILEGGKKKPAAHYEYHKLVVDYTRAFSIIQIVIEKLPHMLESPDTKLYTHLNTKDTWYIVRQTCKLCVTLRDHIICPPNADDALKISCRKFHCAAYTCLTAAICCRKPAPKFYDFVFNEKAWSSIVDEDHVYRLPLRARMTTRKIRRALGVNETEASVSASTTGASTVRTRVFLRTLTDNPLHYDLIPTDTDTVLVEDMELADNELNAHPCAGTFTSLVTHTSTLEHRTWLHTLMSTLTGDSHRNVKYLLAQAICNNKVELAPHATSLRGPLFQFIVQTVRVLDTKSLLNSLHIDVLDTITSWRDDTTLEDVTYLNTTVNILISTIIDNNKNENVHTNLLQCLTRVLIVYGNRVNVEWSIFQPYFGDKPTEETKSCLSILTKIIKHGASIRELVPSLLVKLESNVWFQTSKRWGQLKKMTTLFGQACGGLHLDKYRKILDQIRKKDAVEYIKMLYYAQMECDGCCDVQNFKRIVDLTSSMPRAEKTKCLSILSSYLLRQSSPDTSILAMFDILKPNELIDSEYIEEAICLVKSSLHLMGEELRRSLVLQIAGHSQHTLVKVRKAALGVILKAFQELFPEKTNLNKRRKLDTTSIIDSVSNRDEYVDTVMTSLALGVTDKADGEEEGSIRAELEKSLHDDDLAIRFVECFIMTVYQPTMGTPETAERELSSSLYALLEMFLARFRKQELFKKLKLRDDPLELKNANSGPSKLLTMSKTYQGTLHTYLRENRRKKPVKKSNSNSSGMNVQMPVDNILEELLKFAKVNAEAAISLCVEIVKAIRDNNTSGFEFDNSMSTLLVTLMTRPNGLTPFVVELSRIFIESVSMIDGFQKCLEDLKEVTRGTEGEGMIKLLLEEVRLRTGGNNLFILGMEEKEDEDVTMPDLSDSFTIEALMSTFGKLSNWDDLNLQEKKRIEPELPKIWADYDVFKSAWENYTADDKTWLGRLAWCSRSNDHVQKMRRLKELEKWPVNQFITSAYTECICSDINLNDSMDTTLESPRFHMKRSDCMAEWAARLMISIDEDEEMEGRLHELQWCSLANERGLPRPVLDCVHRNMMHLSTAESMPWFVQKVEARRTLALRANDKKALREMLEKTSYNYCVYDDVTCSKVLLQMTKLLIQLTRDINDPESRISVHIGDMPKHRDIFTNAGMRKHGKILNSIHDVAFSYYMEKWGRSDSADRNYFLGALSDLLGQAIDHTPDRSEALVAVTLHCLDNWTEISEYIARIVLEKLKNVSHQHPSAEDIRDYLHVFPPAVLSEFPGVTSQPPCTGRSVEVYRKCFQLVADAGHSLVDYCEKLGRAVNNDDREDWKKTFDIMKGKIFENEYAGDDYRVLNKYKNELYDLYDYGKTDADTKRQILRSIVSKLDVAPQRVLRLSQLCPELAKDGLETETCLSTLLGLPPGVNIVKFDERVQVMLGSVRRPCVLQARLSDGGRLRLLHKGGERMRADACALRVGRILLQYSPAGTLFQHYEVTPLGDDSGLIQYLEDHKTLREMISDSCKLEQTVTKLKDGELILQSAHSSVERYRKLCSNVPAITLRSAIERSSSCIQDYIEKKGRFLDSLAFMTILVWILGLGDRHLNNLMYSLRDGTVCSVDWAALLQYGNSKELAPARLTRNLLALCDPQVLESRMQGILGSLREVHALVLPMLKFIFKWMGDEFHDKFQYMEGILEGRMLSHQISEHVITSSNEKYKEKYIQLFENVFGRYEKKERYSVEEQVSNLLQHCTDERILGVVRTDWEPWI